MLKIIHLEPYFPTGEATVQPVMLWANGKLCREGISKHASVGYEYFNTIHPIPGHSIVFVLAVSAWEHYGENRNGDGFPEFPYKETENPPGISSQEILPLHYKSFEQYGKSFRHHQNKHEEAAVGSVMKAFWNAPLHRVELLINLDNSKAPDLAERIAAGEFPPVSMGCRVAFDVCNVCLNHAPTRAQYCDHLRYQMREVMPDGKKICALNPSPKFFDISWVLRPADPVAYMMKKVAEPSYEVLTGAKAGEYLEEMDSYKTAAHKMAVIDKIVQGLPVDVETANIDPTELKNLQTIRDLILSIGQHSPSLDDTTLKGLSEFPLNKVLSTTTSAGVFLNTPEITKIVIYKGQPQTELGDEHLDRITGLQNPIFELFEDHPQILEQLLNSDVLNMSQDAVDPKIAELLTPFLEKRSGIGDYLTRQFVPDAWRNEPPRSEMMTVTDPATGSIYGTTRGAAIAAHDEIAKRNLMKLTGMTALLGGAYKFTTSGLAGGKAKVLKPAIAGGLAYLGYKHRPTMGAHYLTDQGIPIPTTTELAQIKTSGYGVPALGTLALMSALSHDYTNRLALGEPVGHPALPFSRRLLDNIEEMTYNHPIITGLLGTALLHKGMANPKMVAGYQKYIKPIGNRLSVAGKDFGQAFKTLLTGQAKLSHYLGDAIPSPTDSVTLPEVDLDKIAEFLGGLILYA